MPQILRRHGGSGRIISLVPLVQENAPWIRCLDARFSREGSDMTEILVQDATAGGTTGTGRVVDHPSWPVLKNAVEEIRPWQSADGSIDFDAEGAPARKAAEDAVARV